MELHNALFNNADFCITIKYFLKNFENRGGITNEIIAC